MDGNGGVVEGLLANLFWSDPSSEEFKENYDVANHRIGGIGEKPVAEGFRMQLEAITREIDGAFQINTTEELLAQIPARQQALAPGKPQVLVGLHTYNGYLQRVYIDQRRIADDPTPHYLLINQISLQQDEPIQALRGRLSGLIQSGLVRKVGSPKPKELVALPIESDEAEIYRFYKPKTGETTTYFVQIKGRDVAFYQPRKGNYKIENIQSFLTSTSKFVDVALPTPPA
ncbi:MAG: hypothetical protein KKC75_03380 [Nanoarchaeota archaeon]|nr:hypothetical protein [Nanoarchaeota archaeon]MBU1004500.1 hypothetical protein [Nanoarchaeota archaeon]MBU1945333.1 hypothetical protein [Nanoarchaeota archaeon]